MLGTCCHKEIAAKFGIGYKYFKIDDNRGNEVEELRLHRKGVEIDPFTVNIRLTF